MRSLLTLIMVCLLSGCQSPPEATATAPDPARPHEPDLLPDDPSVDNATMPVWDFVDCWKRSLAVRLPMAVVEPEVPPNYELTSTGGDGVNSIINLAQYTCDSLVIGNQTVISPFEWATVITAAHPEQEPANATDFGVYQFEWFLENQTAAEVLRGLGFDAFFSEVTGSQDSESVEVEIQVAGETWYRVNGALGEHSAPPSSYAETHYHGRDLVYAVFQHESSVGGLPAFTSTLQAENGIFSRLGTGHHAGTVLSGPVAVNVEFPLRVMETV